MRSMKRMDKIREEVRGKANTVEENPLKGNSTAREKWANDAVSGRQAIQIGKTTQVSSNLQWTRVTSTVQSMVADENIFSSSNKSRRIRRNMEETPYVMRGFTPEIRTTPIDQTVSPGDKVSLKCSATGNPTPVLSWTKNNVLLSVNQRTTIGSLHLLTGEVVSTLNFTNITPQDGGIIRCNARNDIGSSSHVASLNVFGPPFIRQMHNASFVTGEGGLISCPVGGFPTPVVSWLRNGTILMRNPRISVFGNNTLLMRDLRKSDEGSYSCIAEGRQGRIVKGDMYLHVLEAPTIDHFNFPRNLEEGDRTQLTCIISSGDLPININILKGDRKVAHDPGIVTKRISDFSSVLLFQSLKEYHSGKYTCVAANSAASTNASATLSVKYSPKWTIKPAEKMEVESGKSATLDCRARGFPKPIITWRKKPDTQSASQNKLVEDNMRITSADNGSLIIFTVQKGDEMNYVCKASNGIGGHLEAMTRLSVKVGPSIVTEGGKFSAHIGQPIELRCEARGDQPLIITWVKGSKEVTGTRRKSIRESKSSYSSVVSTFQINRIVSSDRGIYNCKATNDHGFKMKEFEVVVLEPPTAPTNLMMDRIRSRSVKLSWNLMQPAAVTIQYKDTRDSSWTANSRNVSVGEWSKSHVLSSLQPFTEYSARVFAYNELGTSRPSGEITFTTDEEAPSGSPKDVRVIAVSAFSLVVNWRSPADSAAHGKIKGYVISLRKQNFNDSPVIIARPSNSGGFAIIEEYLVSHLSANTLYEVSIKAFNRIGSGPLSSPRIVLSTLEAAPSCPPTAVQCRGSVGAMRVWWNPPPHCANGHITGYTVTATAVDSRSDSESATRTIQTTNLEKSLTNLPPSANISIMVLSHTSAGRGPPSKSLYCLTHDVAPDPPENFRIYAMDSNSILATWSPPITMKGKIIHYTVYYLQDSNQDVIERYVIDANDAGSTWKLISGLQEGIRVQVWATSSSEAGESVTTVKRSDKPRRSKFLPIAIGKNPYVRISEGKSAILSCHGFGSPLPALSWMHDGFPVVEDLNHQLLHKGDLRISATQHNSTYTCYARNKEGSSNYSYIVEPLKSPTSPSIYMHGSTSNSLNISLVPAALSNPSILGHVLYIKKENGDWNEITFSPFPTTRRILHTIMKLRCGSSYQLYGISWNKLGKSSSSNTIIGNTRGEAPRKPDPNQMVEVNTTCVTLRLYTWPESGCQISHYKLEFRRGNEQEWHIYNRELKRDHTDIGLCDLNHGQKYILKLSAVTEAGSRTVLYEVTTYDPIIGWITAEPVREVQLVSDQLMEAWFDVHVIAGIISSVLLISAFIICACVFFKRKPHFLNRKSIPMGSLERKKLAEISLKGEEEIYVRSKDTSCDTILKKDFPAFPTLPRDCDTDIYPYATYRECIDDSLEYGIALRNHSPPSTVVFDAFSCQDAIYIPTRNQTQYEYRKRIAPLSPTNKKRTPTCGTSYDSKPDVKQALAKKHHRVPVISKESLKMDSSSDDCYGIALQDDRKQQFLRKYVPKEKSNFRNRPDPVNESAAYHISDTPLIEARSSTPYTGRPRIPPVNFFNSRKPENESEEVVHASAQTKPVTQIKNSRQKCLHDSLETLNYSINV